MARAFIRTWLRHFGRHTGRLLRGASSTVRFVLAMATALLLGTALLLAAGAWKLSRGPVDGSWLADRVNATLRDTDMPVRLSFGSCTLEWEGFRLGAEGTMELKILGLTVSGTNDTELLSARAANLRFRLYDLLVGRAMPRSVEMEGVRAATDAEAVAGMMEGGEPGAGSWPVLPRNLLRLRVRDAGIAVGGMAAVPGLRVDGAELEVDQAANGSVKATLRAPVTVGGEATVLAAALALGRDGSGTATATVSPFKVSAVPLLQAADLAVGVSASASIGAGLAVRDIRASGTVGAGQIHAGQGSVPVLGGTFALSGTMPDRIALQSLRLDLMRAADGAMESVEASGSASLTADRVRVSATVGTDHLDAADLPALWPPGVGGGARPWITQNVTGGIATHASVALTLEAGRDLRDVTVTRVAGGMDIAGGAFTWIDHVPPVEQAEVHLTLIDPDTIDIAVPSARQRIARRMPDLLISKGLMRIKGLSVHDQFADMQFNLDGPVTSAIALLSEPRLKLLSTHPLSLKPAAGTASAALGFKMPLENKLQAEDIEVHADAKLAQVLIPDAVRNLALEDGAFDLAADRDGLSFQGRGSLARVPLTLTGAMNFRPGGADQVTQRIAAQGTADAAQLVAAGLPVGSMLSGPVGLTASWSQRRGGDSSVALGADLTNAALAFAPLAWRKDPGPAAGASAELVIARGQVSRIEHLAAHGDGLALAGSVAFSPAQAAVTLDAVRLGQTDAHGTVSIAPDGRLGIALAGSRVDLGPKLTETGSGGEQPGSPPWSLEARFDQALLAHDVTARNAVVSAAGAGGRLITINAAAALADGARIAASIAQQGGKRHLAVEAADAGAFLHGMDVTGTMRGGQLRMNGVFGTDSGLAPLSGTVEIDNAVVRNSPVLGKLLQAVTVYGLVDALSGPGLGFDRIVVPYRYDGRDFFLDDAVARNSSLGLTGTGRIGMGERPSSVNGTVVPAYFFNALPGKLPLIGGLFSAEKGGGLFAVRFSLDGKIGDPDISVNPVSALTPGFTRGLFGIFDK